MRYPFLSFCFGCGSGRRGQLEHYCVLTLEHIRQQDNLPIGKFQRVVMLAWVIRIDLPKSRCGVPDRPYTRVEQRPP